MEELPFRVSLVSAGEPDEKGLRSLRFNLKPSIKKAYKLAKDDVLYIIVIGIYKNKSSTEINPVEFSFFGTVSKTGGRSSLGITIEKDEIRRRNLTENTDLEIKVKVISRTKRE